MILNKTRKVCLIILCIFLAVLMLSGFVVRSYAGWTDKQNGAHNIAEIAREIGLPEDDPIILRAQVIWWQEEALKNSNAEPIAEDVKQEIAEVIKEEPEDDPVPAEVIAEIIEEQIPEEPKYDYTPEQEDAFMEASQNELATIIESAELANSSDKPIRYTLGISNYTQQDIDIVASVVYNEAAHNTTERQKELVAACVVNRVNCPWLGSSIYEVVCWPSQYLPAYAQYGSYYMNRAMESEEWPHLCEIAERALKGEVDVPYDVIFQAEFTQGRGIYETHRTDYSTTYFCYSLYTFDDPLEAARANGLVD